MYKECCCGFTYNSAIQRYSFVLKPLTIDLLKKICRQCIKCGDKSIEISDIKNFVNDTVRPSSNKEHWHTIDTSYVLPGEVVWLEGDDISIAILKMSDSHWLVVHSRNTTLFAKGDFVKICNGAKFSCDQDCEINNHIIHVKSCEFEIPGKYHRIMDMILLNNISAMRKRDIYNLYNLLVDYHSRQILEYNFGEICDSFSNFGQSTFVLRKMLDTITQKG